MELLTNCYYCGRFVNPFNIKEVGNYHYNHSYDSPGDEYFYHWDCCKNNLLKKADEMKAWYQYYETLKKEGYEVEMIGDTIRYKSERQVKYYSGTI